MRKIRNYFKGVGQEVRRIRWPKKKQLWSSVAVVCVITIFAGLAIYFEDWLTIQVMKGFEDAFPSSASSSAGGNGSITPAAAIKPALTIIANYIGGLIK